MSLKCGIVGLPNVGKSTIFNALTKSHSAESQNFPFCTIEPNVGVVNVPDERFDKLVDLIQPKSKVAANIEFVDIAGIVKGASKGEGLGNQFLSHIRQVDAVLHVVRCFEEENVTHVAGQIDPVSDAEIIELELILSDIEILEKRLEKISKLVKSGDKEAIKEKQVLTQAWEYLKNNQMVISLTTSKEDQGFIQRLGLLTNKPFILAGNIHEDEVAQASSSHFRALKKYSDQKQIAVLPISAKVESELIGMPPEEEKEFLTSLGLKEPSLNAIIRKACQALGYITFFTAGEKEVKAWNVIQNSTAMESAGLIHTDIQKGFIRAEVTSFSDFVSCGSSKEAQIKGKMRLEGKDYIVQDGDVVYFRFNV